MVQDTSNANTIVYEREDWESNFCYECLVGGDGVSALLESEFHGHWRWLHSLYEKTPYSKVLKMNGVLVEVFTFHPFFIHLLFKLGYPLANKQQTE